MFLLKKLIAPLFGPFSISIELLLVGLIFLLFTRKQKLAKGLMTFATLFLVAMSFTGVTDYLVRPLEDKYPPLVVDDVTDPALQKELSAVKWIVVLGGGHTTDPRRPTITQLSTSSLARLATAVRLYKELPGRRLLLTGGKIYESSSEADAMAKVAVTLGVKSQDISLDERSKDTEEEAVAIQGMVKTDRFILVTSAFHMPRAMLLFQHRGMDPIPAPTDYLSSNHFDLGSFFPGTSALNDAGIATHEYLGILWAKLRGEA